MFPDGLIRYPVDVCHAMAQRLAGVVDGDGALTRRLTPEEDRFIAGERLLTKIDYQYCAERYHYIRSEKGLQPLFPLWEPQKIILQHLAKIQKSRVDDGHPDGLLVNVLKARQEGCSTLSQSLVAHRVTTHTHVNALTASDVPENSGSEGIFGKFELLVEHLPWYLKPATRFHKKDTHWVFENGSWMTVESGRSMKGGLQEEGGTKGNLGRSKTFTVLHLCLAPETLVHVAHGHLKPIAEVTPHDWVVTHSGTLARVKACGRSQRRGELGISLWMWGTFAPLTVTRDHPVWTPSGFREAQDLVSGDWVRRPVRPITHDIANVVTFPRQSGRPSQQRYTPRAHAANFELGYLCGLYLAEGTLIYRTDKTRDGAAKKPSGLLLSCDLAETAAFSVALQRVLPDHPVRVQRQNSRTRHLVSSDAGFARWLYREWGEKDDKHIPDWVWTAGPDFCRGVAAGYIEGDGHYVKDKNEVVVVSVRVQLLTQLRDLIASLGYGWSGLYYKSAGVHHERNCRASWRLFLSGVTGQRLRRALGYPAIEAGPPKHWQYANNQRDIDVEVETVGDVYCPAYYSLEVDHPDHTFTTAQCAVSNTEISTWERPEQIDDGLMPAVPRSPRTLGMKESTAKGRHNWHHDDWLLSVRGRGRWSPIFLPWYALERYWLPAPIDWVPADTTLIHAKKAEDEGEKWLGHHVRLTREQLYWYEDTRASYFEKGNLSKFLEEYAADPEECFQHSGRSIFSIEQLQRLESLQRPMIDCWAINPAKDLADIRNSELASIRATRDLASSIADTPSAEAHPAQGPLVGSV